MDQQPDKVGQRLSRELVQVRMGTHDEPRWREAVETQEPRGGRNRAGCARPEKAARSDDADDRPVAENGPNLWTDHEALLREPGPTCRRIRQSLVQAASPRHGSALALPGALGS